MTSGYQNSLVFHYLDTFPDAPGVPEWPALIPEPTVAEIDERIEAGLVCMGTPDEVIEVGASRTPTSGPTSSCSGCCRPRCRWRSRSRRSRRSAST